MNVNCSEVVTSVAIRHMEDYQTIISTFYDIRFKYRKDLYPKLTALGYDRNNKFAAAFLSVLFFDDDMFLRLNRLMDRVKAYNLAVELNTWLLSIPVRDKYCLFLLGMNKIILSTKVAEEKVMGVYYLLQSAEQNYNVAQYYLAVVLVKCDRQQSHYWYRRAANQGIPDAQYRIANTYRKDNEQQCFLCTKMAADNGHMLSQSSVAHYYSIGFGVEIDLQEYFKYTKMAADQNHSAAQYRVGLCYKNQVGTTKDITEAFRYIKLAADQGYYIAQKVVEEYDQTTFKAAIIVQGLPSVVIQSLL